MDRPGLHLILVQPGEQRTLYSGLQIANEQHGLGADPADEGQRAAVRRGRWTHGATGSAGHRLGLASLPIVAIDLEDPVVDVLVVVEGAREIVVDVAAVR